MFEVLVCSNYRITTPLISYHCRCEYWSILQHGQPIERPRLTLADLGRPPRAPSRCRSGAWLRRPGGRDIERADRAGSGLSHGHRRAPSAVNGIGQCGREMDTIIIRVALRSLRLKFLAADDFWLTALLLALSLKIGWWLVADLCGFH